MQFSTEVVGETTVVIVDTQVRGADLRSLGSFRHNDQDKKTHKQTHIRDH